MNRSTLKHSPFMAALMAVASGWTFGKKPEPPIEEETVGGKHKQPNPIERAAKLLALVAGKPPTNRTFKYSLAVKRARNKAKRQARHAAQRRLRKAA